MGSAQSASSTRQDAASRALETNGGPAAATSIPAEAMAAVPSPAEKEEGSASHQPARGRRSLLKFPSLRSLRKRHSVVGINDEGREGSIRSSPSRRRWRALSGIKHRPVSTITDSDVPTAASEPRAEVPSASIRENAPTEKGKEREVELTKDETAEIQQTDVALPDPSQSASEPFHPSMERLDEDANAFSSDEMLRELREMQETLFTGGDPQSTETQHLGVGASRNRSQRPPTPVPTSTLERTPSSQGEGDDVVTGPHSTLEEALGTWLSGSSRGENAESSSSDALVASGSHSQGVSSTALPRPAHAGLRSFNDSTALGTSPTGIAGSIPSLAVPPVRSQEDHRFGRRSAPTSTQHDRRAVAPTGTGTLVVVQGVVHTTDVRHDHAHSPSRPQTIPATARSARSSSSTPTLRAPSGNSSSRSPTRPSTPQAQPSPRRGRFSSLTSSLRPRSRPGTAGSRLSAGAAHNTSGLSNASETLSEPHDAFALSVDSSASESENTSASTSSTDPSTPVPDMHDAASLNLDSQSEVINAIDALPSPEPPPLIDTENTRSRGETEGRPSVDGDGSEDEGEAELSASSIEVLGTLLSVATAATAASLVTGTTDPLFSSGLAGPDAHAGQRQTDSSTQGNLTDGPTPPSQNSETLSSSPESGLDTNAEAAVNTRMRAAWESLRDRFSRSRGRRGAVHGGAEGREDPREQMLREMARAFNTGLGLDPDDDREGWGPGRRERNEEATSENVAVPGVSLPSQETSLPERESRRAPEPGGPSPGPEGSFERFLHNLQVDLRTALTEDYAARRARVQARDSRSSADTVSSSDTPVYTTAASTETPRSESTEPTGSEEIPQGSTLSLGGESETHSNSSALTPDPTSNTPRPATFDLPSLPGASETTSSGSGVGNAPPQAHGITGQPGAGINWWRLYRFPPMQLVPQPSSQPVGGVPATPRQSSSSESPAAPSGEGTNAPLTNSGAVPEPAPGQNVVPVIVVGLQSVPMNRAGIHHHPQHHQHPHDSPSPLEPHGFDSGPPSDIPTRERAWPLRAASRAFGRMGRRGDADSSTDDGTPDNDRLERPNLRDGRQGGRTYLIFVIGGYYPPNHSIVTGADDMNSFEALWELAELLGQVKPPVASREDIEKSGLEIIKASSLPDYEQAGKVASNTVERCLICLDDYDREDDLRLLSCRHVFHKQCVDKWLEQGRNNCPACRTKGVRTGDESSPASPTSDNRL